MKPRLGFVGLGWIGRHRLEALVRSGVADVVVLAEPDRKSAAAAAALVPAPVLTSLDELLTYDLDGVVIATPSALHASQARAALEQGVGVFCQKPLGRTAAETAAVVAAARTADRLLGVDLSYRFVEGARRIRDLVRAGDLGRIYAVDLVFHNAYGPDKPWFYDTALSGGGCVIDLGIHLVDLALWILDPAGVRGVTSHLFVKGQPLGPGQDLVEDFALAHLTLDSGAVVRLACSWNLPAGCEAVIQASLFGTAGGAMLSNVNGSFYDFVADRFHGTGRERICGPPDAWGGRGLVEWAERLGSGAGYDPAAERLIDVAAVLDRIYGRLPVAETVPEASEAMVATAP